MNTTVEVADFQAHIPDGRWTVRDVSFCGQSHGRLAPWLLRRDGLDGGPGATTTTTTTLFLHDGTPLFGLEGGDLGVQVHGLLPQGV